MLELAILKTFDSENHKAGVQLAGSLTTYLDDIAVATNIAPEAMTVGNYVLVAIPGGNPRDACIVASWPAGSSGIRDHGDLDGLADDDHAQYLNVARHDITARHPLGTVVPHESALNNLGNVNAPSPSDDDVLYWDAAASQWKCKQPSGGSVDKRFYALATVTCIWRAWGDKVSDTPRTATVQGIASDVITLTGNHAYRFGEWGSVGEYMHKDSVLVKIQNTTKSQFAWLEATPAANQLRVTDAADISAWQNGDVVSTSKSGAASTAVELDISPLIPAGATMVFLKTQCLDTGTIGYATGLQASKAGVSGTWCNTFCQVTNLLICGYPSIPVQSNRHINVRDRATGTDTLQHSINVVAYIK